MASARFLTIPTSGIERFSPHSRAILEIRDSRDLEVLEKIYKNSVLLGDQSETGWKIHYAQGDFNMTSDSHLFPPRPKWEAKGYKPDEYGRWISPDGDAALPLYQGIMLNVLDACYKGWKKGTGLQATWEAIPHDRKSLQPQFLVSSRDYFGSDKIGRGWKLGYRRVARTTDSRTWIGAPIADLPSGDSIFHLVSQPEDPTNAMVLAALLSSYVYDWQLRNRLGGTNLSWFILAETPCVAPNDPLSAAIGPAVLSVVGTEVRYAPSWLWWAARVGSLKHSPWRRHWAITLHERMRLRCVLDAVAAELYGLAWNDLSWILRDCDHPIALLNTGSFTRSLDPKGFWRVDKDRDPEMRHTVLTLIAFHDLKRRIAEWPDDRMAVICSFCSIDDEGWQIPENLRLADFGLGHGALAKENRSLRQEFGPRWYPWQLEEPVSRSWADCETHAHRLLGDYAFQKLTREAGVPIPLEGEKFGADKAAEPQPSFGTSGQGSLSFGEDGD